MAAVRTSQFFPLFQLRACLVLRKELGPCVGLCPLPWPFCPVGKATVSLELQEREGHTSVLSPWDVSFFKDPKTRS